MFNFNSIPTTVNHVFAIYQCLCLQWTIPITSFICLFFYTDIFENFVKLVILLLPIKVRIFFTDGCYIRTLLSYIINKQVDFCQAQIVLVFYDRHSRRYKVAVVSFQEFYTAFPYTQRQEGGAKLAKFVFLQC